MSFTINARQVNAIRDLVPLDSLLVLTTGGEWKVTGGQDAVVTPSTIGIKPQSAYGTGDLQARVLGESAVFLQAQGQRVRSGLSVREGRLPRQRDQHLGRSPGAGLYLPRDRVRTAPWPILWMPRTDGVLIGCTYMPEQEVTGWHPHETDGQVLDVCCLPGEIETEVYLLVRRFINGEWVQYVEQMAPTRYDDPLDWKYADSLLTYDGRRPNGSPMTLTSTDGWNEGAVITATTGAAIFSGAGDVGNILRLAIGDEHVRVRVMAMCRPRSRRWNRSGRCPWHCAASLCRIGPISARRSPVWATWKARPWWPW